MALFEEQITDTLETGAPSIKYTGKEGPRPSMQSQEEMMLLIINVDRMFRNENIFLNNAKIYLTPT